MKSTLLINVNVVNVLVARVVPNFFMHLWGSMLALFKWWIHFASLWHRRMLANTLPCLACLSCCFGHFRIADGVKGCLLYNHFNSSWLQFNKQYPKMYWHVCGALRYEKRFIFFTKLFILFSFFFRLESFGSLKVFALPRFARIWWWSYAPHGEWKRE